MIVMHAEPVYKLDGRDVYVEYNFVVDEPSDYYQHPYIKPDPNAKFYIGGAEKDAFKRSCMMANYPKCPYWCYDEED